MKNNIPISPKDIVPDFQIGQVIGFINNVLSAKERDDFPLTLNLQDAFELAGFACSKDKMETIRCRFEEIGWEVLLRGNGQATFSFPKEDENYRVEYREAGEWIVFGYPVTKARAIEICQFIKHSQDSLNRCRVIDQFGFEVENV